jgi:hypothetical protein
MPSPSRFLLLLLFALLTVSSYAIAEPETGIQQAFNQRYQNFFAASNQALLPFARMEKDEWKKLLAGKAFKLVFTEPNKFYNNKTYTFRLYQSLDDNTYYLDAIGGFWGMEELVYGPIPEADLK